MKINEQIKNAKPKVTPMEDVLTEEYFHIHIQAHTF